MRTTDHRANRLFIFLAGFFLTNALIAEFVGVKIFALEDERRRRAVQLVAVRHQRHAELHRRRAGVAVRVHHDGRHQRVLTACAACA